VFETGDEQFLKFAKQGESDKNSRIEFPSRSGPITVPVVVVFTQFDKLVSRMEENLTDEEMDMSDEDIDKLCLRKADAEFETLCLEPLRKVAPQLEYAKTSGLTDHIQRVSSPYLTFIIYPVKDAYRCSLANLIERTQALVEHQVEGDVWIVSAMAQRANAQTKIDSSIR
jgi:hypothetical protein